MSHRWTRLLTCCLTVSVAFCLAFAEAAKTPSERYLKPYRKAHAKADKERWDKVLEIVEKMERLGPNATVHLALLTEAHIQLGDHDAAFATIERAVKTGWANPDGLEDWEEIEPLREDPRYAELHERAVEMGEAWMEHLRKLHRVLPPDEAESFASAEALVAAFEAQRSDLQAVSLITPFPETSKRGAAINDAEIAAAQRYVDEHPDAEDAADAGVAAVRAANRYKKWSAYMDGDAAIVIDTASRFLGRWPDSDHKPEVELSKSIATWKSYAKDEGEATLERRAAEALPLFEAIDEGHPETPEATKARIWRMTIGMETSNGDVTPEIHALYGQVEPMFEEDDELKQYAWQEAPLAMFQINGREFFEGTDLDGNTWSWETMEGKVVLIDFWATWCGPCVADIPHIKETYDKYEDAGFAVVGVSLDGDDRETFLAECEDLGVEWPQIYDGKGWSAELARTFSISGVPTPVLVDRDGKVVAVHGDVRGDKLIEEVGKLIDSTE